MFGGFGGLGRRGFGNQGLGLRTWRSPGFRACRFSIEGGI